MTREKSPDREKALKIWLKSGRQKKSSEIAAELGLNPSMVRKWKSVDKWDEIPPPVDHGEQRRVIRMLREIKGA